MKAIIFDFDGTLADTLPVCFYAFQSVFKEFDDIEVTEDEIKSMFGPSETGIIKENLKNSSWDQAIDMYYHKYSEKHVELVTANEEVKNLLHLLKKQEFKLAIVTGKARRSLDISLDHLDMNDLFDVIITGDDVSKPKPHPEGLNQALTFLNITNDEAMFIGDSDADIEAGKKANVHTIGVQWLPNFQTQTFSIQPDQRVSRVGEFIELLISEMS
ncbi:HAD family hydrolase [Rossellomorea vietnamensis]|uniref:HAD family hydrolase n=1 Tax=Rossellomorea vietnamensis TaxID=218284 RepID=UPI0005560507|nr:HAD family hydrolase [Rossellomorea vietnamensis]